MWVLSNLEGASLLPTHMLAVLRICVGSGACWSVQMMQGATLKGSGMGSTWMHAGQGDFPRICVGLLRLCMGLKLVGESGSRWSMSKRELVGQEKEVDDEEVEEEPKGETFFIATIFSRNEIKETEMSVKCEDPGPCLVTSKIRGVDIPECLCDLGACGNIMPYALYETLDLGPLKKSKEVFTTVDASIVSVAGIADNVMRLERKVPINFESVKIGPEKLLRSEKKKEAENPKNDACMEKGLRIAPLSLKKDGKKESSKPAKKKKKHEEVKTRKKKKKHEEDVDGGRIALKCSSLGNFLGKLNKIGKALCNNKKIDAHLVKDRSK
ncbi:hypothetical protein PIB30_075496 [Stylosanthes scabra]|uniref:Uncharacterized protein n=1 Tax=Stylosanthes scabra TaxID=79078 RepID=A0ABU6YNX2_9FABA|nr:hypothetical protein [Stylosanthes scabra]